MDIDDSIVGRSGVKITNEGSPRVISIDDHDYRTAWAERLRPACLVERIARPIRLTFIVVNILDAAPIAVEEDIRSVLIPLRRGRTLPG